MGLRTALLIASNQNNVHKLTTLISNDIETIYIQLICDKYKWYFADHPVNRILYKNFVLDCYKNTTITCSPQLDIKILLSAFRPLPFSITTRNPIDIVYFDNDYSAKEMNDFLNESVVSKANNCRYAVLKSDTPLISNYTEPKLNIQSFKQADHVVLGGTFDKMHNGHKILFSEAILRCRKKLTIGITDNSMLESKILPELIDPCDVRVSKVKEFLEDVEPNLEYCVVPIYDIYGPTKDDPSMQMIVVSQETKRGGEKINNLRKANGLNELDIICIDLIDHGEIITSDVYENKISSSNARINLLGTLLSPPMLKSNLSKKPYIIGLTGGIAAGKTAICDFLEELGAKCIVADRLGHLVYDTDANICNQIASVFGSLVLNEQGSVDRKVLANIVFSDRAKLNKLNEIVWPAILKLVMEQMSVFSRANTDNNVIVLEAAVLIQANWQEYCHEVWSSIIPKQEAITRLKQRNNLTENEALARLSMQPTNSEYVKISNVLFCTLWDKKFTEQQVLKAWNELQKRI